MCRNRTGLDLATHSSMSIEWIFYLSSNMTQLMQSLLDSANTCLELRLDISRRIWHSNVCAFDSTTQCQKLWKWPYPSVHSVLCWRRRKTSHCYCVARITRMSGAPCSPRRTLGTASFCLQLHTHVFSCTQLSCKNRKLCYILFRFYITYW